MVSCHRAFKFYNSKNHQNLTFQQRWEKLENMWQAELNKGRQSAAYRSVRLQSRSSSLAWRPHGDSNARRGKATSKNFRTEPCPRWTNPTASVKSVCSHQTPVSQQAGSKAHPQTPKDLWLSGWMGVVSRSLQRLHTQIMFQKHHWRDRYYTENSRAVGKSPPLGTRCKPGIHCLLNRDATKQHLSAAEWVNARCKEVTWHKSVQ